MVRDEEKNMGKDLMQKLSPSDLITKKKTIFKLVLNIIPKNTIVLSRLLVLLRRKGIKSIETYGNEVRIVYSSISKENILKIIDKVISLKDLYDLVCYQVYVVIPYSKNIIDKVAKMALRENTFNGIRIIVTKINNLLYWIYVNMNKGKVIVKNIKRKLLNPDPDLISESFFIECISVSNDINVIVTKIREDLEKYIELLTAIDVP